MSKILLILFLTFGLLIILGNTYGQEVYKKVDAKGTVHFSDNPTSGIFSSQKKQISKENTYEILKRLEVGNRHIPKDQMGLCSEKHR